jgi:LPXTG-site transpeptidase (sortase) family protein
MGRVIATARYTLQDNWTIFSGLMLAGFALVGMVFSISDQVPFPIVLPPRHGIGELAVPLKPLYPHEGNADISPDFEEKPVLSLDLAASPIAEGSVQVANSPADLAVSAPQKVKIRSRRTRNSPAIHLEPENPVRIMIPSIGLEAPIVLAEMDFMHIEGKEFIQWRVPEEFAAGWHSSSAKLGATGNTVLNGHHNAFGEVFKSLIEVSEGDIIQVDSENSRFSYQITNKMILPEKYEQIDTRMKNAQWILPSVDERLTLISCWPYETNTHRLIVVARPIGREKIKLHVE